MIDQREVPLRRRVFLTLSMVQRLIGSVPPAAPPSSRERKDAYGERLRIAGKAMDEERLLRQRAGRAVLAEMRRRERALFQTPPKENTA